jgi:methyl-accepting chemotaxis protein
MIGNWFEGLIILIILFGIGYTIFRGGSANPVSTGSLKRDLNKLDGDVKKLTGSIASMGDDVAEHGRKFEKLDACVETLVSDIARLQTSAAASQKVVEAMAESVRLTNEHLQSISNRLEGAGAITAQVPAFMERVLRDTATTAAQTEAVSRQVDRLYDIITKKGLSE